MVMADCKVPQIHVIFLKLIQCLSQTKSRNFVNSWRVSTQPISRNLRWGLLRESVVSTCLLADVDGEAVWDLAKLTKGPDFGNRGSILGDYWPL